MADTKRSIAEILTLLADNGVKGLSAQDLRDAVVTIQPDHGELHIATPAETSITDSTSFFQVAGTFAASGLEMDWDMDVNGRLRYIGVPDRVAHIAASWSLTSAGNNKTYHIGVCKNGTNIASATLHRKISTGSDVGTGACHAFVSMSTNDYLCLGIKNPGDLTNATLETGNLFAMGMAK